LYLKSNVFKFHYALDWISVLGTAIFQISPLSVYFVLRKIILDLVAFPSCNITFHWPVSGLALMLHSTSHTNHQLTINFRVIFHLETYAAGLFQSGTSRFLVNANDRNCNVLYSVETSCFIACSLFRRQGSAVIYYVSGDTTLISPGNCIICLNRNQLQNAKGPVGTGVS
jgi:hypothetical protein